MIYKQQYNSLFSEPEVKEPKIIDDEVFKFLSKDYEAYNNWLSSRIEIVGEHSFEDGKSYEVVKTDDGNIHALSTESPNDNEYGYFKNWGSSGTFICLLSKGEGQHFKHQNIKKVIASTDKRADLPYLAIPIKREEIIDQTSTNDLADVASHSCTSDDSIQQCERILCSAIWFDDGKEYHFQPKNIKSGIVFCGFRHSCIFQQIGGTVKERQEIGIHEKEQGFLTNKNRFVDREEAARIALEANQIKQPLQRLFSEDLY
jgi:hypothetical protein